MSSAEPRVGVPEPQNRRDQWVALVLRSRPWPVGWGIGVAAGLIAAETALVLFLHRVAPENAFGAIFFFAVLVVSAGWNSWLAVATSLVSAAVYVMFHLDGLVTAIFVFLPLALLANLLAGQARLRAIEAERRRQRADALAAQQAALRRVATLVAREADLAEINATAVTELARGLDVEHTALVEFVGEECVVLAAHDTQGRSWPTIGERFPLEGHTVTAEIRRTGRTAHVDDYRAVEGALAERLRGAGFRSGAGAPITVAGQVVGALIVASVQPGALADGWKDSIGDVADLVSTAIANARTREQLRASRARVVTAADQARRGIERDLHDGAQQRIVALGLRLRGIEATVPAELTPVRDELDRAVQGLGDVLRELQELSRGIHPAVLSNGGLGPALRSLARRSAIPATVDVDVDGRLPEPVEVAAYYVTAEALANAAKHSGADGVTVTARVESDELIIAVSDDGVGGAATADGSGLIGLSDRVEAVGGRFEVVSPAGAGTTLTARLPVAATPV
ncbi:GAF domain-containing protein [Mycobacterium sp. SMC-8]|uniref:sensor histidine kinase n=1 Tax=Mycobacterium sp. SMC-8 TaxID=2857060 RepID=UPI0021B191EE|nr:GAF domain-containing protein [Mycobacterium sp. SMC-8]